MQSVRWFFFLVAGVALALFGGLVEAQNERAKPARSLTAQERQQELEVLQRPGRVREMARLRGRAVIRERLPDWIQLDTPDLVAQSTVAVVVIPESNRSRMTANEFTVQTVYSVSIQEALKGDVALGERIRVVLPTGMVQFEDGSRTEVRVPGFRLMENGRQYVLFLTEQDSEYVLTGGNGNAMLEIDSTGKLNSHARRTDVMHKQTGREAEDFLAEVRRAVAAQQAGP